MFHVGHGVIGIKQRRCWNGFLRGHYLFWNRFQALLSLSGGSIAPKRKGSSRQEATARLIEQALMLGQFGKQLTNVDHRQIFGTIPTNGLESNL